MAWSAGNEKKYIRKDKDALREERLREHRRAPKTVRSIVFNVANAVRSGGVSVVVERKDGKAHTR